MALSTASLVAEKDSLRRSMRERRGQLGQPDRAQAAAAIATRLVALGEVQAAGRAGAVVAGFAAKPEEIDPGPALGAIGAAGARVAYPRVGAARPRVTFHLAAAEVLARGAFDVLEPPAEAVAVGTSDVAVMIVPGLAFDDAGHRLGFGGGYYDEVLTTGRPGFVVGIAFDFQVVPSCPAGEGDARVDCVVTDRRVIRCTDGPGAGTTAVMTDLGKR